MMLCRMSDLAPDSAKGFDPWGEGRDTLFVVRSGDTVRAWLNSCPHMPGSAMAWRKDAYLSADSRAIVCYGHGAIFDIDSGRCTSGPCIGESLSPVPVHVSAGGDISLIETPAGRNSRQDLARQANA